MIKCPIIKFIARVKEENRLYKEERVKKEQVLREFMKEHEAYLPKFSPRGVPLHWDIHVVKDGEYDIYTGRQSGEYKVTVNQIPPRFLLRDSNVYRYNIETKSLETVGLRWSY